MRALIATGRQEEPVEFGEIPEPVLSADQALVRVEAFSLNRADFLYLASPGSRWRVGTDAAGVVERPAPNGRGPVVGARVVVHSRDGGAGAERIAAATDAIAVLPEAVSAATAASLPLAGLLALRLLRQIEPLSGKRILITGASGGVGQFVVQLAVSGGAKVAAIVSSEEPREQLTKLGAAVVRDIEEIPWAADVLLESVGGRVGSDAILKLARGAQVFWFGEASGQPLTLDFFRFFGGHESFRLRHFVYSEVSGANDAEDLSTLVELTAEGRLSPQIGFEADWSRTSVALRNIACGRQRGKAVLTIARERESTAEARRLVIVRSIVELHGGTVTAESDGPGKGATFVVALPIATLRADSSTPRPAHDLGGRSLALEPSPALAGLRVVVVDDESEGRDLLQYVLEQCGSEVTVAGDAEEALATVSGGTFDVLISDIGMPKRDGYALIAAVRALPPAKGGLIPAVALTAYASAEDRTRALRAGFDMHLPKPVQPGELVAIVGRLVEGVRRRSAPVHLSA